MQAVNLTHVCVSRQYVVHRKGLRIVNKLAGLALPIIMLATGAVAQNNVTTTNGGAVGIVPVFTTGTDVENSPISVSGGNVGIGTTSPAVPLDVSGAIRATGDVVPGNNGVIRSIVPLALPGGDVYVNSPSWQEVTRVTYTPISNLFSGTPVLPGATRQYYLIIRRADNVTQQVGSSWRFSCAAAWNNNTNIPGHGFSLPEDWGDTDQGSIDWVQIPPTAISAAGCSNQYWEIDAEQPSGGQTRVMSVSIAAVDVYGGSNVPYSAASSGNATFPLTSALYDNIWSTGYNGNVGIGTTTPTSTLEVDGNLTLTQGSGAGIKFPDGTVQSTAYTGTSCATGGDYAESIDVGGDRSSYAPGDVLVIDPTRPGDFLKSSQPYSKLVAGIYSTKPGFVGRRQKLPPDPSHPEVPMAMIGIVPTHVSAENGAIEVGDLLVTSSTPGYAMKGTDFTRTPGAIVGKALGALPSGSGTIEVLVTLQ